MFNYFIATILSLIIVREGVTLTADSHSVASHADKATVIRDIDIVLGMLDGMHQRSYEGDAELQRIMADIEKGLQSYVSQFVPASDNLGVLESPKNGVDPLGNPGSAIEISALFHKVHFLHDLTAVPEYARVGEGNVKFGSYNYMIGRLAAIAQEIVARRPDELNQPRNLGPFRSLADILTTYNALVAYVKRLKIIAEAISQ